MRQRIGLFETVVGRLQPILAKLPSIFAESVLGGHAKPKEQRDGIVSSVEVEASEAEQSGFDLDAVTDPDLEDLPRQAAPLSLDDLNRVISRQALLPAAVEASSLGHREYRFRQPGLQRDIRVTTDASYYEQNSESMELWSPGNPAFPMLRGTIVSEERIDTLGSLLDEVDK